MNMRKLALLCIVTLATAISSTQLSAQEAPRRETVLIDRFDKVRNVPMAYAEILRDKVIRAFLERGRNRVIDAQTMQPLADEAGRNWISGTLWQSDYENRLMTRATDVDDEIRYIISGAVLSYDFGHKTIDGKQGFSTSITLVLTGYDRLRGTLFPIKRFSMSGEDLKADKADAKAIDNLSTGELERFINENIKFECAVLEQGKTDRNGVAKECYIHCGSDMGVHKGDLFIVYANKAVGSVATREKIGRLRVKEVQNGEVSLCAISDGKKEITASLSIGEPLTAVSDGKALFY